MKLERSACSKQRHIKTDFRFAPVKTWHTFSKIKVRLFMVLYDMFLHVCHSHSPADILVHSMHILQISYTSVGDCISKTYTVSYYCFLGFFLVTSCVMIGAQRQYAWIKEYVECFLCGMHKSQLIEPASHMCYSLQRKQKHTYIVTKYT